MSTASIIENAQRSGRKILDEIESKRLLTENGVPTTDTRLAKSHEEAISLAGELGLPVALKIVCADITHKSDIGGVQLGLSTEAAVAKAYDEILAAVKIRCPDSEIKGVSVQSMARSVVEIIVGMSKDPQFGPVLMFGLGGTQVEILEDVSFRIAPISRLDAREMIREIKGYPLLEGYRGSQHINIEALEDILLRISELVAATPQIKELDLNPIFARPDDAIAVDARVILE